jgi:L-ribulose-5-phosphate 4-epimerase
MGIQRLKEEVCRANLKLAKSGLVILTWGNASGIDREAGVMAIKPSGVEYDNLKPVNIVVLSLETGEVVEGDLRPSSDTPTHLLLYRKFKNIGGVVHAHSRFATSFAQAGMEIPCLGTTHADHFYGPVPLTRSLTTEEIHGNYELNTGVVIVERFVKGGLDPKQVPGVLVHSHGPFVWGEDAMSAVESAIILEEVAQMSLYSRLLDPEIQPLPQPLLDKHFLRKHGPGAYYGQK